MPFALLGAFQYLLTLKRQAMKALAAPAFIAADGSELAFGQGVFEITALSHSQVSV